MRLAAVRALGFWLALFALFAAMQAITRVSVDEFVFAVTAATLALLVLIGWLATILLRQPRAMARTTTACVIALLVVPAAWQTWDGSTEALPLRAREAEAFDYLKNADMLEMPLVGFGGLRSRGYLAMRILGRSPNADAAFKELIRSGTRPGQLYGLIGVRRSDPVYFELAALRYSASLEPVAVFSGCIIGGETIGELVRNNIANGAYSRVFLDREPDEWAARADEIACDFSSI